MPDGPAGRPTPPAPEGPPRFDPSGPTRAPVARDADALAEPVAAAVLACPASAGLSAGPFGTVGTYLPGRRVTGVQITDTEVTVRLVARLVPLRSRTSARSAPRSPPSCPGLPIHSASTTSTSAGLNPRPPPSAMSSPSSDRLAAGPRTPLSWS